MFKYKDIEETQETENLNTEKLKQQPSKLILNLLGRLNPPKELGNVGFFDLSNYNKGNNYG